MENPDFEVTFSGVEARLKALSERAKEWMKREYLTDKHTVIFGPRRWKVRERRILAANFSLKKIEEGNSANNSSQHGF